MPTEVVTVVVSGRLEPRNQEETDLGGSDSGTAVRSPGCSGPEWALNPLAVIAGCPLPHFSDYLSSFVFLPGLLPDLVPSFLKPALPLATFLILHTVQLSSTWMYPASTSKPSENLIIQCLGSEVCLLCVVS